MQWVFLVLGLVAALAELQTGTFYLAAVAAVALGTYLLGFWVDEEILIFVFCGGCLLAAALVRVWRRSLAGDTGLRDFDAGQEVTVSAVEPGENRLTVTYRGTRWDAVMDDGPQPAVGAVVWIRDRRGNVLHVGRRPPVRESL